MRDKKVILVGDSCSYMIGRQHLGVDISLPKCPRCGRHINVFTNGKFAMQAKHKNPATNKWCRASAVERRKR